MKKMFLILGVVFALFCVFFLKDIAYYNSLSNKILERMSHNEMLFSSLVATVHAIASIVCLGFYSVFRHLDGDDKDEPIENLPLLSRSRGVTDTITDPQEIETAQEA